MSEYTDNDYLSAYGMTRAEVDALNERVCKVAGLCVDKCPTCSYHDAITALGNLNTTWVIRSNKADYHVKVGGYGKARHHKLCIAICIAIARKEKGEE